MSITEKTNYFLDISVSVVLVVQKSNGSLQSSMKVVQEHDLHRQFYFFSIV